MELLLYKTELFEIELFFDIETLLTLNWIVENKIDLTLNYV